MGRGPSTRGYEMDMPPRQFPAILLPAVLVCAAATFGGTGGEGLVFGGGGE